MPSVRIKQVHYSSHFLKSFSKLPFSIQALAKAKDAWFHVDPFDSRLRTHKLKGELSGSWAYSVNQSYRVLFRFISHDEVLYYDIGTHAIYR